MNLTKHLQCTKLYSISLLSFLTKKKDTSESTKLCERQDVAYVYIYVYSLSTLEPSNTEYYSITGHPNFILHNSSFERVEQFKYFGKTLMNQNSILEEIKRRLRSVNSCYHLVQNLLSSTLPSKNIKVKIQRPIIVPVVLYGCETWLLKLQEECRLKVSENKVLKRISGHKTDKVTEKQRKLDNEELTDMNSSLNVIQVIKEK